MLPIRRLCRNGTRRLQTSILICSSADPAATDRIPFKASTDTIMAMQVVGFERQAYSAALQVSVEAMVFLEPWSFAAHDPFVASTGSRYRRSLWLPRHAVKRNLIAIIIANHFFAQRKAHLLVDGHIRLCPTALQVALPAFAIRHIGYVSE